MTELRPERAETARTLSRAQNVRFWLIRDRRQGERWVRVDLPARALGAKICILKRDKLDVEHANGGVAIFRLPWIKYELLVMRYARQLGARVLLDVDACLLDERVARLFAINSLPLEHGRSDLRRERDWWRVVQNLHVEAVRFADAVLCASRELVERYRPLNANVHFVPNQIDPDDWPQLDAGGTAQIAGDFRIGFAGHNTHVDDLHLIRDALAWAATQSGVEIVFFGWHPGDVVPEAEREEIEQLVQAAYELRGDDPERARLYELASGVCERQRQRWAFPITVVPWTNSFERHARNLPRLDVGLCPCDDAAPFSRYRADGKPLEYAMSGALPIVSRSRAYVDWVDRVPVADDAQDFVDLVRWAVEHRDEVRERALELRAYVLRERTIEANLWRWEEALTQDRRTRAAAHNR